MYTYDATAKTGYKREAATVRGDWEQFEALLGGGVNLASSSALRQALRLVRGEPLGS